MAEKLFESLLSMASELQDTTSLNQWLFEKFKHPDAPCTLDEFAVYFLGLVKTQTDEFIKNNTSTCNTPRKLTVGSAVEDRGDSLVQSTSLLGKESEKGLKVSINEKHSDDRSNKRQPARQLFSKQEGSVFTPSDAQAINSPFSNNRSGSIETSTPVMSFSKNQRSFEGTPGITPNSFKNTKNSFYLNDQSSLTQRNNSRNSFEQSSRNTSSNRRNSSSPFCLGDFINTSSSQGKGKKKSNACQQLDQTPTFNASDFPPIEKSPNVLVPRKADSKPKKRVVPITISNKSTPNSSNFVSSSFQSDNNLLSLSGIEAEGTCDILTERRMLRAERDAISKDFTTDMEPQRNLHAFVRESFPAVTQSPRKASFQYDDSKVVHKEVLVMMAKTHSFLIDMNLIPSVLSEFTYFFSLLNTEQELIEQPPNQSQTKSLTEIASSLLKSLQNCVFFASQVLNYQKKNLALLDVMSIRVILQNERTQQLTVELFDCLRTAVQTKSKVESSLQSNSSVGNNLRQVFFQQETDNRDNFPSEREFSAFKKQRDLFYVILRSWEFKHLEANYNFRSHLDSKIRSLVTQMEHPVNMAHLARLFTAQLIISCNFDNAANELQMVLPNIDLMKLSKLRQRLVAPSQFSTQYLFPGSQAFFRDFITCCDQHMIFMEQLKISLINELMQINDSTMEVFCITRSNDDESNEKIIASEEFIVRSEAMTTMRVLAKFVGFVISRPYSYEGYRNPQVDQKQSEIRNFMHPDFDVKQIVLRAIDGHKLLVTIPWLVEYLSMLDYVTIRLKYYRELFQLLQRIYLRVNVINGEESLCVLPTSKFIVRSCLGWLFEHPVIPEDYFNQSNTRDVLKELLNEDIRSLKVIVEPNAYLESILNAACPFLADFRVSMMPQQTTKAVSRTGRYRHITTKFQDKSTSHTARSSDNRSRLIEAFLASQTISVRKIVDFTIDRVTSAVIKDFQVEHLLRIKKEAKFELEELANRTSEVDLLVRKIAETYHTHLIRLQTTWAEEVKKNGSKRVQCAFDSLVPIETLPDVKKTLLYITLERTKEKFQEWSSANIATIEVFSKDIYHEATKLKEKLKEDARTMTKTIIVDLNVTKVPSEFFSDLQDFLYRASLQPETLNLDELLNLIEAANETVEKQIFSESGYRNIAFYTLQVVLMCIANRCDLVTDEALRRMLKLWSHEKLSSFTIKANSRNETAKRKVSDFVFSNVISSRLMLTMQGKPRMNLEKYADFLVCLVKEKFITLEQINEQSVSLYKCEWSAQSLNDIAFLIGRVKSLLPSAASPDSQLFMELVVDLARDMENF